MLQQFRQAFHLFLLWLFQEKHKQQARRLRDEAKRVFTEHPTQTGETYLEHLWFTIRIALRFLFVSAVLLTHGLFPFLFTRTASSQIERVYVIMRSRIPKVRRDIIEAQYDI